MEFCTKHIFEGKSIASILNALHQYKNYKGLHTLTTKMKQLEEIEYAYKRSLECVIRSCSRSREKDFTMEDMTGPGRFMALWKEVNPTKSIGDEITKMATVLKKRKES